MKRCLLGPPSSRRKPQGEELSGPRGKEGPVATAKVTACPRATLRPRGGAGLEGGGPERAQARSTLTPSMTGGEGDACRGAAWAADQPPAGTKPLSEAGDGRLPGGASPT